MKFQVSSIKIETQNSQRIFAIFSREIQAEANILKING